MRDTREPWEIFFESWAERTQHVRRVTPIAGAGRVRSPAFGALDTARSRTEIYARDVLRWPRLEARLVAGFMALALIEWTRLDGEDRAALRAHLLAAQERGRTEAARGSSAAERLEATLSTQLQLAY
jgi:hypothetical protein